MMKPFAVVAAIALAGTGGHRGGHMKHGHGGYGAAPYASIAYPAYYASPVGSVAYPGGYAYPAYGRYKKHGHRWLKVEETTDAVPAALKDVSEAVEEIAAMSTDVEELDDAFTGETEEEEEDEKLVDLESLKKQLSPEALKAHMKDAAKQTKAHAEDLAEKVKTGAIKSKEQALKAQKKVSDNAKVISQSAEEHLKEGASTAAKQASQALKKTKKMGSSVLKNIGGGRTLAASAAGVAGVAGVAAFALRRRSSAVEDPQQVIEHMRNSLDAREFAV